MIIINKLITNNESYLFLFALQLQFLVIVEDIISSYSGKHNWSSILILIDGICE